MNKLFLAVLAALMTLSSVFAVGPTYMQNFVGSVDPTVTPLNAQVGVYYAKTNTPIGFYRKNDNGTSTNWTLIASATTPAGGSPGDVQWNNGGVISGGGGVTLDGVGNVSGNSYSATAVPGFNGDGSGLTNLTIHATSISPLQQGSGGIGIDENGTAFTMGSLSVTGTGTLADNISQFYGPINNEPSWYYNAPGNYFLYYSSVDNSWLISLVQGASETALAGQDYWESPYVLYTYTASGPHSYPNAVVTSIGLTIDNAGDVNTTGSVNGASLVITPGATSLDGGDITTDGAGNVDISGGLIIGGTTSFGNGNATMTPTGNLTVNHLLNNGQTTFADIIQLPVQPSAAAPTCAAIGDDGKVAITNAHALCICNGNTPGWFDANTGLVACTF